MRRSSFAKTFLARIFRDRSLPSLAGIGGLEGKVALVTGGSSGIGRAAALAFARVGAKVVVADIAAECGEETVSMVQGLRGEALFVRTDVSKRNEVEAVLNRTIQNYGRVDFAFNNAGTGALVPLAEQTEEDFDRVINVNLKGVWLCMKYEIHQMLTQHGGVIVNCASAYGLVGSPDGESAYAASKHGVIGLTKSAALEYAKAGIRINAVCPGWIRTPMVERLLLMDPQFEAQIVKREPAGRMGNSEDVADAVVWLCSDAARFVTGHAMAVDGGLVAQ